MAPVPTEGLHLSNLSVPRIIDVAQKAKLFCSYAMGNRTLNSVKWYKDGLEFFRWAHPSAVAVDQIKLLPPFPSGTLELATPEHERLPTRTMKIFFGIQFEIIKCRQGAPEIGSCEMCRRIHADFMAQIENVMKLQHCPQQSKFPPTSKNKKIKTKRK